MEKLQAALAKARAQRDGKPVSRHTEATPASRASGARRASQQEALDAIWGAVPMFEPTQRRMRQSRIFAKDPTSEGAQFDILRTKLLLEMRRNNWTRIGITSPSPASGKTTTACNLISGLGRQPEVRGMLFDFDMRRPAVNKFFGAAPDISIVDVLEDRASFKDNALRLSANTIISVNTRAQRDPAQIMLRQRAAEIIDDIQAEYQPDVMLFDLPPVMVSDETRAFLKQLDAVLIVAAANATTIAQVDQCEREVAEYSNVAGIVLNKCRFMDDAYGYSY